MTNHYLTLAWYRQRHFGVVLVMLLAYLWSVCLPAGVMPQADGDGDVQIMLCSGYGPISDRMQQQATKQIVALQQSVQDKPSGADQSGTEDVLTPCQWSVLLGTSAIIETPDITASLVTFLLSSPPSIAPSRLRATYLPHALPRGPPALV